MAWKGGPEGEACRLVVLGGSKGGCGRSTICRNMLVAAGQDGLRAIGFDLDEQGTFRRWSERRGKAKEALGQIVTTNVVQAEPGAWRSILDRAQGYQIAVIDTAPGVEHDMGAMLELCRQATLVLVPTSPSNDDLESVVPWFRNLAALGAHAAFVLNKANRRTKSYAAARTTLLKHGSLAPVEVAALEDISAPHGSGLAAADYEKSKGADAMADLWTYVRREIRL